jgi:hypothetical protein
VAHAVVHTGHAPEAAIEDRFLYGIVAEFEDAPHLVAAARRARAAGYRKIDGYSPLPVEGLSEALGQTDITVPLIMLGAGILGGLGGFALVYYCLKISYPMNIGGRPMYGWPFYMPITFEMTVLTSAIVGIAAMFGLNGLPQPYHPLFDVPHFDRASSSAFFLCVEATDPKFDRVETLRFMESLGAVLVSEVELRK